MKEQGIGKFQCLHFQPQIDKSQYLSTKFNIKIWTHAQKGFEYF